MLLLLAAGCTTRNPEHPEAIYARYEALVKQGKFDAALREAESGLGLHKSVSEPWHWKFYLARAEVVLRKEGPDAARILLDRELPAGAAFEELRARRKWDQARVRFQLSDYAGSRIMLAEAARMAALSQASSLLTKIELWQSDVLARLGDWPGAEERVQHATRLARELHDTSLESFGFISLAFILIHQSRFEEAIQALEQAAPLLDEVHDSTPAAKVFTNLGWCYYKLGDWDKALYFLQRAEALDARSGDIGEQQICLGGIGDVYYQRGDFAAARQNYLRALELASKLRDRFDSAKWLSNLALLSIESQDWNSAEKYSSEALRIQRDIPDRAGELHSLKNAGRIAQGYGRNDEAERLFQQVIHSDSKDPAPILDAEAALAQLYASTDRPEKADQQFRAALALVDSSRSRLVNDEYKLSYLASLMEFYQSYVDWLMSGGKTEQALEVAEASRAQILSERTGVNRATQASSAARYKQLALASGSVFLSYWTAPKRSFVWVITPKQIVAYPLPRESRIKSLVENYRGLIENLQNPLEVDDPSGRELYDALLVPVREFIPDGARVAVVPDGSLYALNFETLPAPGARAHYWIEDATVSVVPSLNLLGGVTDQQPAAQELLLIGNPRSVGPQFPQLPYASEEMGFVRRHFDASRVTVVEGQNAMPASYRGSQPERFSYLHFTAHATANRESPLDSAIILSGSKDGYELTAREVMKQPLRAGLVTISACRSAGAKTYAGEGLVGFTWTFFQAGAHNVIAGLWDVSDESTPKIMDRLYAGISERQPVAEALRTAKLAILRGNQTFRLPYYWGALQLYCRDRLQNSRNVRPARIASN